MPLKPEILKNFQRFDADWATALRARLDADIVNDVRFQEAYEKLVSMQAWRGNLLAHEMTKDALCFFLEAQNDGVISHIQASIGSWRVAIKSLRSLIENVCVSLYFADHPVEMERWRNGKFRISFSDVLKYLKEHPNIEGVPDNLSGLSLIKQEYDKLSKAVHASSEEFRMTDDGLAIKLWHTDDAHVNKWCKRQKNVLHGINLLLIAFYKERLQGTAHTNLREIVALAIPGDKDTEIRDKLGVRMIR